MLFRILLLSTLLLLGCAAQSPVASNPVDPDAKPYRGTTQLDGIRPGLTNVYFSDWANTMIPVSIYAPHDVDLSQAPILFMMHGAKRAAARYLSEWDSVADEFGFIVVAPKFSRTDFPGSAAYNRGNVYARNDKQKHTEETWTFSAIEPLFDYVVAAARSNQKGYTLYGHSAGSQFVHRFMYAKPESRAVRFLPANAGWYTMPDTNIDYPYGLAGTDTTEAQLRDILQRDVVVLLGDADNNPNHSSLRRSEGAMQQGAHRYARGLKFLNTCKAQAVALGTTCNWSLRVAPGVAHSNGGIAAVAGDLIRDAS